MKKKGLNKKKQILAFVLAAVLIVGALPGSYLNNLLAVSAGATEAPEKTSLTEEMFTVSENVTYSGAAQNVIGVAEEYQGTLTESDYTVSYKKEIADGAYDAVTEVKDAGSYQITVAATEESVSYEGIVTFSVTVSPLDLSACEIAVDSGADLIYTGSQLTPGIVVTNAGNPVDTSFYTCSYGENINAGENAGSVIISAPEVNENVTGSQEISFTINPKEISERDISVTIEPAEYTLGTAFSPTVKVTVSDDELDSDEYSYAFYTSADKTQEVTGLTEAQTYYFELTLQGNYTGSFSCEYTAKYEKDDLFSFEDSAVYKLTGEEFGGYYNSDVTISLKDTEKDNYYISKNNYDFSDRASAVIYGESSDGTGYFYLKDTATGAVSRYQLPEFTIDKDAPALTVSGDDKENWKQEKEITVSASDTVSGVSGIYYSCEENNVLANIVSDSAAENKITAGTDLSGLISVENGGITVEENIDGETTDYITYYIYAIDNAGNLSGTPVTIGKVDISAPTMTGLDGPYWKNGEELGIAFQVSDAVMNAKDESQVDYNGSGIAGVDVKSVTLDEDGNVTGEEITSGAAVKQNTGGSTEDLVQSYTLHVTAEGIYQITVTDNAGNSAQKVVEVKQDSSTPQLTKTQIVNDGDMTAEDSDGGYYFRNSLTVSFKITDRLGTDDSGIAVDTEKSECIIVVSGPDENGGASETELTLSSLLENGDAVEAEDGVYTYNYTITEAGSYRFSIKDEAGNAQAQSVDATAEKKENTGFEVAVELNESGKTGSSSEFYNKAPTINGTITTEVGIAKISYEIVKDGETEPVLKGDIKDYVLTTGAYDADAENPCELETDLTTLNTGSSYNTYLETIGEGVYKITYTVTDVLGNTKTSDPVSFAIDKTDPETDVYIVYDADVSAKDDYAELTIPEKIQLKVKQVKDTVFNTVFGKTNIGFTLYVKDGDSKVSSDAVSGIDIKELKVSLQEVSDDIEISLKESVSTQEVTITSEDRDTTDTYTVIQGIIKRKDTVKSSSEQNAVKIASISDLAGNKTEKINLQAVAEENVVEDFILDNVAPTVSVEYPKENKENNQVKYYSPNDNSGYEKVELTYTEEFYNENLDDETGQPVKPVIKVSTDGAEPEDISTVETAGNPYVSWGTFSNGSITATVYLPYCTEEAGEKAYIISTTYTDGSENSLIVKEKEGEEDVGLTTSESDGVTTTDYTLMLDNKKPEIAVEYPKETGADEGQRFYSSSAAYEEINLTYTERFFEENLEKDGTVIKPTITVNGTELTVLDTDEAKTGTYVEWEEFDSTANTIKATVYLPYSTQAGGGEIEYVIASSYEDVAGNLLTGDADGFSTISEGTYTSKTLVLDNRAPELLSCEITETPTYVISGEAPYTEGDYASVYENNNAETGDVTIKFVVDDNSAYWQPGALSFVITNRTAGKASVSVNGDSDGITWSSEGRTHTAVYTFDGDADPANYDVTLAYADKAGNVMAAGENTGFDVSGSGSYTSPEFVLDHTAPVFDISYNKAYRLVKNTDTSSENDVFGAVPATGYTAYYAEDIDVTLKIAEDYAVAEKSGSSISGIRDFVLKINGSTENLPEITWTYDKNSKTYTGKFTLSEEGNYQITVSYSDAAKNVMTAGSGVQGAAAETKVDDNGSYTSTKLVIDKTAPKIEASYGAAVIHSNSGRDYFNQSTTLTLHVTDANIRNQAIKDSMLGNTAYRIEEAGTNIYSSTSVYSQLDGIEGKEIITSGSRQYVLNLTDEANYDLLISGYEDLAGNKAVIAKTFESEESTKVTEAYNPYICVDTSRPVDVAFSYTVSDAGFMDAVNYADSGFIFADKKLTITATAKDAVGGLRLLTFLVTDEDGTVSAFEKAVDPCAGADTTIAVPLSGNDFKGTVEVIAADWSDNTQNKLQGQIVESGDKHNSTGSAVITTLTQPSRTVNGVDFYNTNVVFNLTIKDEYSGLRSYSYTAGSQISESYDYSAAAGYDLDGEKVYPITNVYTKDLTLVASANNQNDVAVEASYVDNAGHTGSVNADYNIDITAPTIDVTYDNNNAANEKYYKADRIATVVITERNFDANDVQFTITNTDGVMPSISGWTTTGSGDNTKHIATVSFTADGDYTFTVAFQDMAGNRADYSRVDEFTVDKTIPTYTVTYDNNNAKNGNYYDADRAATIDILEHNFDASAVTVSVTRDGAAAAPYISGWTKSGDHNIATVSFASDGDYTFTFSGVDMADNPMAEYSMDSFTVDTQMPEIEIFNIENYSANNDVVQPGIRYSDTNYDANATVVEMVGYHNGTVEMNGNRSVTANGVEVLLNDFERTREMDDIYTMHATVYDLAGNSSEAEVIFSVNRFGSVYTFDDATDALVGDNGSYYTNEEQDIVVIETNVDTLQFKEITCNLNGDVETLAEDEDFTVKESGTETSWKQYEYNIDKSNFEAEGTYILTIYSEDRATNTSDNNSKGKKVEFVVDKTNPSILISGIEDGASYLEDSREVTIDVDDNVRLASVDVELNGETTKYDADEIENGKIVMTLASSKKQQTLSVAAYDAAGNEQTYETMKFLIASNAFIYFFAHKALFGGTVGAAAVVAAGLGWWFIFLPMKRRKDEEDGEQQ